MQDKKNLPIPASLNKSTKIALSEKDWTQLLYEKTPDKLVAINRVAGNLVVGDTPEYKISSAINELLNCLSRTPSEFKLIKRKPSSETIVKINHNNLKSKNHIIKQYLDHSAKIEDAYKEINSIIAFGKDTILRNLNDLYYSALDEIGIDYLVSEIDIQAVRENSDFIIEYIIKKLKNTAFESGNTPAYKEHIELGVNVVVAHAFIECIIMENPQVDS